MISYKVSNKRVLKTRNLWEPCKRTQMRRKRKMSNNINTNQVIQVIKMHLITVYLMITNKKLLYHNKLNMNQQIRMSKMTDWTLLLSTIAFQVLAKGVKQISLWIKSKFKALRENKIQTTFINSSINILTMKQSKTVIIDSVCLIFYSL